MTRAIDFATCILAFGASLLFARVGAWPLAVLEAVLAAGLLVATLSRHPDLGGAFQIFLMLQLLAFGAIWPSALTLAALLVLPAAVVRIATLFSRRSLRQGTLVFVAGSALVASSAVLGEAVVLLR